MVFRVVVMMCRVQLDFAVPELILLQVCYTKETRLGSELYSKVGDGMTG